MIHWTREEGHIALNSWDTGITHQVPSWFCLLLPKWPWTSHLALCLHFHICKMGRGPGRTLSRAFISENGSLADRSQQSFWDASRNVEGKPGDHGWYHWNYLWKRLFLERNIPLCQKPWKGFGGKTRETNTGFQHILQKVLQLPSLPRQVAFSHQTFPLSFVLSPNCSRLNKSHRKKSVVSPWNLWMWPDMGKWSLHMWFS